MASEFHKDLKPVSTQKEATNQTGEDGLLAQARQRAADGWSYWRPNYDRAQASVQFNDGNQWEQWVEETRERTGRPTFTFNRMPQYVNRVVGDMRENRIQATVTPVDNNVDEFVAIDGSERYNVAEIYQGLIRNMEALSNAQDGYVEAGASAVNAGFGWLRLMPEFVNDETFEQDLIVKPIRDIYSVMPDPGMQEPNGSDMQWCMIRHLMSLNEFRTRWPNARLGELVGNYNVGFWATSTSETVHVCEYYHREPTTRVLCLYQDGSTGWKDEAGEEQLQTITKERKVKRWKVLVDLITANEVLEKQTTWQDDTIPIVPVWGQTSRVGPTFNTFSLTYHAIDAQQSFNVERTSQIEVGNLAPKKPAVGTATQFEGYEDAWDNRNAQNISRLPYNADPLAPGPPSILEATMPPVQHMHAAEAAAADIQATIGIYNVSLGANSEETSGRAIIAKQNEAQLGNNIYMHNLATAVKRIASIFVRMVPYYYSGPRVLRILHEDGSNDTIPVNQVSVDPETGAERINNDLSVGRYDVSVNIGKAYGTQRMEDAEKLLGVVQAMPMVGEIAPDLVVGSMDFAAAGPLKSRLEKTIPQELRDGGKKEEQTPEEQQAEQAQVQQVQQAAEIAQTTAKAELVTAQAKMEQAYADMAQAQADKIKARADIVRATEEPEKPQQQAMQ